MSVETYNLIAIISGSLAGVMLITSILLFLKFKIPKLIGDLNGSNARKAIEQMRKNNFLTGEKTYQTSQINLERGKLTEKISPSGNLKERQTGKLGKSEDLIKKNKDQFISEETTLLSENETESLTSNQTQVLGINETAVLTPEQSNFPIQFVDKEYFFVLEVDTLIVGTNEVI